MKIDARVVIANSSRFRAAHASVYNPAKTLIPCALISSSVRSKSFFGHRITVINSEPSNRCDGFAFSAASNIDVHGHPSRPTRRTTQATARPPASRSSLVRRIHTPRVILSTRSSRPFRRHRSVPPVTRSSPSRTPVENCLTKSTSSSFASPPRSVANTHTASASASFVVVVRRTASQVRAAPVGST